MSIQHSQQLQQIRYAKQYVEPRVERSKVRRPQRRRVIAAAAATVAAFVAAGFTTPADAGHPIDDPPPAVNTSGVTDGWLHHVDNIDGTPAQSFELVGVTDGWLHHLDNIYGEGRQPASPVEGDTDGWLHHDNLDHIFGYAPQPQVGAGTQ